MKMIEVLDLMAEGEIEKDTKLIVSDGFGEYEYKYKQRKGYRAFYNNFDKNSKVRIDDEFRLDKDFLNLEVKLIPPMKKKYLIKVNVQWFDKGFAYLNYDKQRNCVIIYTEVETITYKTQFTKQELQSIKPIREFFEDMEGKYELIEVEDNEID